MAYTKAEAIAEHFMRDIEFRGKRRSEIPELDGEWVYGSLYHAKFWQTGNVLCKIIPYEDDGERYHIHPDTVGQYTGLKDINGVKIFEGDIVQYSYSISTGGILLFYITWDENVPMYIMADVDNRPGSKYSLLKDCISKNNIAVIGNIHDNPELLEDGK